jgi:flagellar basal-body rod protein FlgB
MSISFDSALGIHQQALLVRTARTEMLASNIANVDTPGYKAIDIDFKAVLQASVDNRQQAGSLNTTHSRHIQLNTNSSNAETLYRVPTQSSLDGNTVDGQVEKAAFAENAIRYQASLEFLSSKFKGMLNALKSQG